MNIKNILLFLIKWPAVVFEGFQDIFLLLLRLYVGWQFFHSGLLKLNAWDNTLFLFQYEYQVPLLPPYPAAVLGTFGELFFPVLLWVGLTGRLAAAGLQAVNVMAVISYAHVIFNPEFGTGAATDHYYWGLMMLVVMIYGPGKISLDEWLERYSKRVFGLPHPKEARS